MILNEDLLPSKLLRACFDLWALISTNRLTLIKFPGVIPSGWTLRNFTPLIFKTLLFFLKQQNPFFKDNLCGSPVHKRQMLSFFWFWCGQQIYLERATSNRMLWEILRNLTYFFKAILFFTNIKPHFCGWAVFLIYTIFSVLQIYTSWFLRPVLCITIKRASRL